MQLLRRHPGSLSLWLTLLAVILLTAEGCGNRMETDGKPQAEPPRDTLPDASPVPSSSSQPGPVAGAVAGALQTLSLKQGGAVSLRLAETQWELSFQPVTGDAAVYRLEWKAGRGPARKEPTDFAWGAAPPFEAAWASGEEASYSAVLLRSVQLDAATSAVLVTQRGGFEHLRRRSELLLPSNGGWKQVWVLREPSGPFFNAVEVTPPRSSGAQDLLVVGGRYAENEGGADQAEARLFRWDGSTMKLVVGESVFRVASTPFPTVDAAHAARSRLASCAPGLFVIPAGEGAVLGSAVSSAERAEELRQALVRCDANLTPRVFAVKTK